MKVFISWSKEPSKFVAAALKGWLKDVIQCLDPWMTEQDIASGERSMVEIGAELQERNFGILVLTAENQFQPWINYEAGALSKALGNSRVVPYIFRMKFADLVAGPLTQFQGREATKEGTFRLMVDINALLPDATRLSDAQLRKAFDKNWPDLETELTKIAREDDEKRTGEAKQRPKERGVEDKVDEMLVLLRDVASLARSNSATSGLSRPVNLPQRFAARKNQTGVFTLHEHDLEPGEVAALERVRHYMTIEDLPASLHSMVGNGKEIDLIFSINVGTKDEFMTVRSRIIEICNANLIENMHLVIANDVDVADTLHRSRRST